MSENSACPPGYTQLENLRVSSLGLGCAGIGNAYGANGGCTDHDKAIRLLQRAYQNGITFFDTAPSYGMSEQWLGEALSDSQAVFSTKFKYDGGEPTIEDSRRNLGRDQIDLLQIHNFDGRWPLQQGALESVRYFGATVYEPREVSMAVEMGIYDAIQVPFNMLDRRFAKKVGRYFSIGRSPLLQGALANPLDRTLRVLDGHGEFSRIIQGCFPPEARRAVWDLLKRTGVSDFSELAELALRFCFAAAGIDLVLLGIQSEPELEFALRAWRKGPLDPLLYETLSIAPDSDPEVIDPRKWRYARRDKEEWE